MEICVVPLEHHWGRWETSSVSFQLNIQEKYEQGVAFVLIGTECGIPKVCTKYKITTLLQGKRSENSHLNHMILHLNWIY